MGKFDKMIDRLKKCLSICLSERFFGGGEGFYIRKGVNELTSENRASGRDVAF